MIWAALGDPGGYVEPFAGSAAVLLARPPFEGRRMETLNDADGWLVNAYRSIKLSPAEVINHLQWPLTEIDLHARLAWLQSRRNDDLVSWLEGDPEHHDAKAAAWWLYAMSGSIGVAFEQGPWHVSDNRLQKLVASPRGITRKRPHLSFSGQGTFRANIDLEDYMHELATRLRYVRITCGDWKRVCTMSAQGFAGNSTRAVLLDPPYSNGSYLYAHADVSVVTEVAEWCRHAERNWRIVLCGREDWDGGIYEGLLNLGWKKVTATPTTSGYGAVSFNDTKESLWLSPACLDISQQLLFTLRSESDDHE